jgi:hypothetical protein
VTNESELSVRSRIPLGDDLAAAVIEYRAALSDEAKLHGERELADDAFRAAMRAHDAAMLRVGRTYDALMALVKGDVDAAA